MTCSAFRGAAATILVLLGSCEDGTPRRSEQLLRTLAGDRQPPVDTAAQRRREQFEKCSYVYDMEDQLRECLVLKSDWAPPDAARAIAIYKAQLKKSADSIRELILRERAEAESIAAASRLAQRRERELTRRRKDSVYLATHKERLDGPATPFGREALPWMIDTRTKAYYSLRCSAAELIPIHAREFYASEEEVKAKGWPSRLCGGESTSGGEYESEE